MCLTCCVYVSSLPWMSLIVIRLWIRLSSIALVNVITFNSFRFHSVWGKEIYGWCHHGNYSQINSWGRIRTEPMQWSCLISSFNFFPLTVCFRQFVLLPQKKAKHESSKWMIDSSEIRIDTNTARHTDWLSNTWTVSRSQWTQTAAICVLLDFDSGSIWLKSLWLIEKKWEDNWLIGGK